MTYMNPEAKKVDNQIQKLVKKRDKLRGKYIVICGHCRRDNHDTYDEHNKHHTCYGWPAPLGIYDSEWEKDSDGRWSAKP